ncbi:amidase signature domain-containing protein [Aspergillus karnatakaensis]|uniref:amidase n=1 Tax=Aspergillus karnatakaensis TaxID=1810916 RepID=UPI003CCDA106
MAESYRLTATEALKLIKSNELTVQDYARSLLSRIESRDETVKAWAYLNEDLVLEEARKLDEIPPDQRGPLHGVAIGVKDVIYTKDMPTEHNSPLYIKSQVPVDAASVAILRAAGALIFGKTTTTEFASTVVGPPTCNPHDPTRTPGGSSSGSGAAVGDFQVPIALGTQTGGSTIRPGSFNGVYALKPTWGAISREGQKIYSVILDTLGIYGRSVEDLEILAEVLGVKDDVVSGFEGVSGAKFGVVKGPVWKKAGSGTIAAMDKAKTLLESHGAIVEEVELPAEFDNMPDWHAKIMAGDGRVAFLSEYRVDKTRIHESLVGHVEGVKGYSRAEELAAFDGVAMLRPRIDEIAGRYAAILTPSVPDEAPVGIESTGSAAFNGMWTALHVPVINIPGFKGENAMPVGLSLVAPRYHDQHLLNVSKAVGAIFEKEGGWKSSL